MLEYLGFSPDTKADQASALFAARYGVPPLEVLSTGGGVLAGPVPGAVADPQPVKRESLGLEVFPLFAAENAL